MVRVLKPVNLEESEGPEEPVQDRKKWKVGEQIAYLTETSERWVEGKIESIDRSDSTTWLDVRIPNGSVEEVERDSEFVKPHRPSFPVTHTFQAVKERYDVLDKVGFGSTCIVKTVKRRSDGKHFAMKQIKKKRLDIEELEQVMQEIRFLKKANHPNIVKIEEYFVTKSFICIILEYLEGGHLFDFIAKKGKFSEFEAAKVMRQILSAISYIHASGACHRDIKPLNLMLVDEELSIKLIDFGFIGKTHKEMNTTLGSPQFLAPEIILQTPYTNKVDVWASGMILYMLLTGVCPYTAASVPKLFENILHNPLVFPEDANVSRDVRRVIAKMLEKDPAKRATAAEILNHRWFFEASPTFFPVVHQKSVRLMLLRWRLRRGVQAMRMLLALQRSMEFEDDL